jgi:NitT/TauT family transport system substrate-binding protein
LLVEEELIPAPLVGTYAVPDFPPASVPSQAQFEDVLLWTMDQGLIEGEVRYGASVDASYLP